MIDSDTCQSRIYNILDYHTKMRIQVEKKNSNFRKYATRTVIIMKFQVLSLKVNIQCHCTAVDSIDMCSNLKMSSSIETCQPGEANTRDKNSPHMLSLVNKLIWLPAIHKNGR